MTFLRGPVLLALGTLAVAGSGSGRTSCSADFEVRLSGAAADAPPVSGACVEENGRAVFRPAFPLMPGVESSVRAGGREVERLGTTPPARAPSVTARLYPSAGVLPANQLKLYVEFTAPVMLDESRRRIRLLKASGVEVSNVFLALNEEMWDSERRRLTLLFEPGRLKRALKANVQSGAPLQEGATYTLVIDREWPDAHGTPMIAAVSKRFTVTAADRAMPAAAAWRVDSPLASTHTPLTIKFGEPMDYAVALNAIQVIDDRGRRLEGSVALASAEREWRFTPSGAWRHEPHTLVADSRIEDLAGNNLMRPFDVDLRHSRPGSADAFRLRFTPRRSAFLQH